MTPVQKKLLTGVVATVILAGFAATLFVWQFLLFLNTPVAQPATVTIGKGWSLTRIAETLEQQRVVPSARFFVLAGRVLGEGHIQAGEYRFQAGETPLRVLERLHRGDVLSYRLVIPEGRTVREVGELMAAAGWHDAPALLAASGFAARLGLESPSLEGWLFPDTYFHQQGDTAEELVRRMVGHTREVLAAEWEQRPPEHPLSAYETLVFASIVEKETGLKDERGLISGVFHNRLRKRMRLQSDPTVIYGIADFDGNLTRTHLKTPTPYNTYTHRGLPPTPIANPGREAIHAAFHPTATSALYFVADGSGGHVFADTLEQHNHNVDRYQRRRNRP